MYRWKYRHTHITCWSMHVCIQKLTYTYVCMYIHIYIYIYMCIYVYTNMYWHIDKHRCEVGLQLSKMLTVSTSTGTMKKANPFRANLIIDIYIYVYMHIHINIYLYTWKRRRCPCKLGPWKRRISPRELEY